jgi:Vault protein inter-alpha-trypsin domain
MKRVLCWLLLTVGLTCAADTVELSAGSPRNEKVTATLRIERLEARVVMRGELAETQATLTLSMDADPRRRMEGRLVFPLPADCTVTGAALDIGDIMRPASITAKETAKRAYDSVVSRMLDPCLVQLLPDSRVSVQVFPFADGKPRKLRLEFAHIVGPGAVWRFPLTFASPVPVAILTADVPMVLGTEERREFSGDWSLTAPSEGREWQAHPDGAGRWLFHAFVSHDKAAAPPRHVLVVADVSASQAKRDAAAERAFLERLFQMMETGRVTLVTFSTEVHTRAEFAVEHGKCGAVIAAIEAMACDGAPRPGAVDVSGIPADLTLVLSTLTSPMGGGSTPRLPANAPVWVLDSVSPAPSAAVCQFVTGSGGKAIDPRATAEIPFHRHPTVTSERIGALAFQPQPGGWLITGELSFEFGQFSFEAGQFPAGGPSRRIRRGSDAAAGALTARFHSRGQLLRSLANGAGRDGNSAAPFLTENTAFIVLENLADYRTHGIPLPPDLAKDQQEVLVRSHPRDDSDIRLFARLMQRPPGTKGDARELWSRMGYWKRQEIDARLMNEAEFQYHRQPQKPPPQEDDAKPKEARYEKLSKQADEARSGLKELARQFGEGSAGDAADIIRKARTAQLAGVNLAEFLSFHGDEGWSSAAGAFADPFSGHPRSSGVTPASPPSSDSGNSSAPFVPPQSPTPPAITVPAPDAGAGNPPPAASSRRFDPPQIPQTFGGGGVGLLGGIPVTDYGPPEVPSDYAEVLTRATALHAAGKRAEAIRAISNLAIPGQRHHFLLRLLAWVLEDWNEPTLALEVLAHAERTFRVSDTATRDLALAALVAGRREEARSHFERARWHVTRRDAAGLNGALTADLRVVAECADNSDIDLEIEGPEYELCSRRNPLPAFGGVLSSDGYGMEPEDYVLPVRPPQPLEVRVHLHGGKSSPVRVTITEQWGLPDAKVRVIMVPECKTGKTVIAVIGPRH